MPQIKREWAVATAQALSAEGPMVIAKACQMVEAEGFTVFQVVSSMVPGSALAGGQPQPAYSIVAWREITVEAPAE